MDKLRRTLLKRAGGTGLLAAALAAGMFRPGAARAEEFARAAFETKNLAAALQQLGAAAATESADLTLRAPDIAENGVMVPVDVVSNIPDTVAIAVLVDANPFPLSSVFEFGADAVPEISVRLKLAQTSNVKAIAKTADGRYFLAQKEVKVTAGGCGG